MQPSTDSNGARSAGASGSWVAYGQLHVAEVRPRRAAGDVHRSIARTTARWQSDIKCQPISDNSQSCDHETDEVGSYSRRLPAGGCWVGPIGVQPQGGRATMGMARHQTARHWGPVRAQLRGRPLVTGAGAGGSLASGGKGGTRQATPSALRTLLKDVAMRRRKPVGAPRGRCRHY